MNYSNVEAALQNVRDDIVNARQRCTSAKGTLTAENSKLGGMPTTYAAAIAAIDAGLAANPTDEAWQVLAARKTILVVEFQALKPVVQAAADAMPSEF